MYVISPISARSDVTVTILTLPFTLNFNQTRSNVRHFDYICSFGCNRDQFLPFPLLWISTKRAPTYAISMISARSDVPVTNLYPFIYFWFQPNALQCTSFQLYLLVRMYPWPIPTLLFTSDFSQMRSNVCHFDYICSFGCNRDQFIPFPLLSISAKCAPMYAISPISTCSNVTVTYSYHSV
jgi:hypothetical protein